MSEENASQGQIVEERPSRLWRVPWKITDVAIATALIFVSFLVLLVIVWTSIQALTSEERTLITPWLFAIFEGLMLVAVWFFAVRKYRVSWRTLGFRLSVDSTHLLRSLKLREKTVTRIVTGILLAGLILLASTILSIFQETNSISTHDLASLPITFSIILILLSSTLLLSFRLKERTKAIAIAMLLLPLLALIGSLLFTVLYATIVMALGLEFLEPEQQISREFLGEGITRSLYIVVIGLWGPFAEEVFFRGFLFAALVVPLGLVRAALVSAAVFAIAHLDPGSLIPIFVTGLLLAWLYTRTRSLWPPIVAHAGQNLLALWATFQMPVQP